MARSGNTTPLLQDLESGDEDTAEISTKDDELLLKPPEPKDSYNMGYLIFYLLGIATLLPWNFYVTANDYWMYKFRNVSDSNTSGLTFYSAAEKRTPLQAGFTSYLSLASSVPNLIFLALNTAVTRRVSLNTRVLGSLYAMLFLMMLTLVFVDVNTDGWQHVFFGITLTIVILMNVCSAIFGGSIFGIVGRFSPNYITAVIGGQALGGIFAAVAQIGSLAIGASSTHSALVYFVVGNLTIILTIISYVVLEKSIFFKYHTVNEENPSINQYGSEAVPAICNTTIFKKIWGYGFCVFICFAVTLSICPGITVLIESEGRGHQNKWNDVYFVPTVSYLLSSIGDYLGRLLAVKIMKPKNITFLTIVSLARIIFIPLLLMCNVQPRNYIDVVFDKDYQYMLILFICLLSNGYIANITAIFVPKVVDHHEKEIASSIMTIFMGVGLTLGSAICLILVHVMQS